MKTKLFQSTDFSSVEQFRINLQRVTDRYGVKLIAIGFGAITPQGETQMIKPLAIIEFPDTLSTLEADVISKMIVHEVAGLRRVKRTLEGGF